MTRKELAKLAFDECNNPETTVKRGWKGGFPFWNVECSMFMYVPAFHFTGIRLCKRYVYKAVDEKGGIHTFEASDCCELLTPIWKDIPEGVVQLTVTALDDDGKELGIVGARTFYKHCSFPEKTPERKCTYKECAIKAYKYALNASFAQYWLNEGRPDPSYDLNVYPSKMISRLVLSMISFAKLCPDDAEKAMKICRNAADYLIKITPRGNDPLADIPPTYNLDFCPDPEKYGILTPNWHAAKHHFGTNMMIYPALAGQMFAKLYAATNDKKYLEEALKIGEYFKKTQLPNGSWYLVRNCKTGEPTMPNYISPMDNVVPFLMALYEVTGDSTWMDMSEKSVSYVMNTQLPSYNWEGQFEDSPVTAHYVNLTHYGPMDLVRYLAKYHADDPEKMAISKELLRFCEDQFLLWGKPYPWRHSTPDGSTPYDTSIWHTPAGLEQFGWYVPIDASTANFVFGFLAVYKATGEELYLAKAKALADQLTVMQHDNGQIPTHWMNTEDAEKNFWFNCLFYSCDALEQMIEFD